MYAEANDCESPIQRAKILRRVDILEQNLNFQGANPKKIPFDDLKEHVRAPTSDPATNVYKERIKNRATAIRAYCIQCMGGGMADVRECASLICPLHPFRMGKDPLRGWDLPKFEMPEVEIEDDETDLGEFEDTDEDAD